MTQPVFQLTDAGFGRQTGFAFSKVSLAFNEVSFAFSQSGICYFIVGF